MKKQSEKTVADINNWFNSECREALNEIPKQVKELASKKREYVIIIAESIARKKCFQVKPVLAYLDSLI